MVYPFSTSHPPEVELIHKENQGSTLVLSTLQHPKLVWDVVMFSVKICFSMAPCLQKLGFHSQITALKPPKFSLIEIYIYMIFTLKDSALLFQFLNI